VRPAGTGYPGVKLSKYNLEGQGGKREKLSSQVLMDGGTEKNLATLIDQILACGEATGAIKASEGRILLVPGQVIEQQSNLGLNNELRKRAGSNHIRMVSPGFNVGPQCLTELVFFWGGGRKRTLRS